MATAALIVFGITVVLQLSPLPSALNVWLTEHLGRSAALIVLFLYPVAIWAMCGATISMILLVLKPRNVVLYGVISAVTFIVTMRSWDLVLEGNFYGSIREIVFILTVPYLYWLVVRMARRRHNMSLNTDASDAGAS